MHMKKMNQIHYILILFEKLCYEHVDTFHVQGTKSYTILLGQSQYTLLPPGQSSNH